MPSRLSRQCALRLLAYADSFGAAEELVGDLLEEIARGRSQLWVYQQVIGLYGCAFTKCVRTRARLTPQTVALAFCALLLAGVSIGSVSSVLEAWLGFYVVAGTLSLFAHMASRAVGGRGTVLPAEAPNGGR
jgi:hypothetical protein